MRIFAHVSLGQIAFLVGLAVLGGLSYLAASFDTFPGDEGALTRFQGLRSGWLDDAAVAASALSDPLIAIISIPIVSLILWVAGFRVDAAVLLLVYLPQGINLGLKELVDRPRPELSLIVSPPTDTSFPSGHSVHAFLFFGLLIFMVRSSISQVQLRLGIQALLGAMILGVGASRVYLGVHWPSDVAGGYLLGALGVVSLLKVRERAFYWFPTSVFGPR